jgi:hypothetical protein
VVVLLERERLGGQSEAIAREYAGLYRKALIEGPVPPPEAILVDFEACRQPPSAGAVQLGPEGGRGS